MSVTSHKPTNFAWPAEPATGRGRSHGTSSSEPFDRWFRYPAGFASDYVSMLLDRLDLSSGAVIDCFAGSGVTGTGARRRGLDFIGIEAHPLVGELARLKLSPSATGHQVRDLAAAVAGAVRDSASTTELSAETDLVRRSFSDDVLGQLLALRSLIKERVDEPGGLYLKWSLLATLRDVAGVKVGWPYQRPGVARKARYNDPLARFETRAGLMADDLDGLDGTATASQLLIGDSQDGAIWAQIERRGAACIASPPYLNNFDYADATRLELYFWGEVTTWAAMCREVRSNMVTATTQQSSVGAKAEAVEALQQSTGEAAPEILQLVEQIGEAQASRGGRSKEYDRVAPAYFVSMSRILAHLYASLEGGATALWLVGDSAPYGVYVDTPGLIGQLGIEAGFERLEDVQLRVRGNRWGSNSDRHKVQLAERLVVMRKPA